MLFSLLLLAHLLGDYPLQTDRLMAIKGTQRGLLIHVGIHFLILVVLVGWFGELLPALPYLLLLTTIHYAIDTLKNKLNPRFPNAIFALYLFDQLLHLLSIGLVVFLLERTGVGVVSAEWVPIAIGALLISHVVFVTERVAAIGNSHYVERINAVMWPRMIGRLLLFAIIPLDGIWLTLLAILAINLFYFWRGYTVRWLLTDVLVASLVAMLVALF